MGGNAISEIEDVTIRDGISDNQMIEILSHNPVFYAIPGYSTLMDLAHLQHGKVVFIPTPGQTEQEYLGKILSERYGFTRMRQESSFPEENTAKTGSWPHFQDSIYLEQSILQIS